MRRSLLRLILGTSLVGLAMAAGCQRGMYHCPCWSGGVVRTPPGPTPAGPLSGVVSRPPPGVAAAPPPLAVSGIRPAPEVAPPPVLKKLAADEQTAVPVESPVPSPAELPSAVPVAGPGHAPDHSWLVGRLQYVHVRDAWRIRYAPPGETDCYGGTVTLVETGPMAAYRSGQLVRVEGQVVDPASREPSPAYQVKSIQAATTP